MGEELYELPKGWVWVKFEQLVQEFQNGLSKRKGLQGNPTHVLRLANIVNGKITPNEPRDILLTDEELEKYLLKVNELICIRVNGSDNLVGRVVIFNEKEPWAFCDHFIKISLIAGLVSVSYISYLFNTKIIRNYISLNKVSSAGQNTVSQTTISAVPIPLPPLAEQHRIVTKIEELFTQLDAGVELLKKVKAKLKRYRQAVLKAAVEGNLTKEWREANQGELEPASVLLERIFKQRREKWEAEQLAKMKAQGKTPKDDSWKLKYKEPVAPDTSDLSELPDGWIWGTIAQVAECLDYMREPVSKDERAKRIGNVPYYGANGLVGYIDEYIFDEPLVLVVEDETFIGRQIPFSYKITGKSWVNNHAHVLRATQAVDTDFLNYSLAYYPFTPLTQGTTGRRKLTQIALISAPYRLPPLEEQKYIVEEVERHLSVIDKLEKTIDTNIKRAERLRQTILKQAFEGKLVPQDPNDEPAEKLLERIKAEKANREADKKPKRQSTIKSKQPRKSKTTATQLELKLDD
ncbi:MAG: restriction endonuclease subunit S [Nostoc sp. DedSLP03]|uniref:restriction endonuclease subunit S n=1 Tax=Nostoc sp. DedSLP03 TaxID=3075400 RepID=UPI002AD3CFA2|nr:restriction endonuclease subunit S [Nostoc sp. DedSLP03]MDZ7969248.1 restriction endonuclease subunit S [Nostoc sp. DedSLP03]